MSERGSIRSTRSPCSLALSSRKRVLISSPPFLHSSPPRLLHSFHVQSPPPPFFPQHARSLFLTVAPRRFEPALSLSLAFLGLAFSPALNSRTSERKREGTTLARCSLSSISTLAQGRLPARKKRGKKLRKTMAASSSPMPVPGGLLGQGNQNGGTPTLGNKGAPTPMGRRRESRVSDRLRMTTLKSSVFSSERRGGSLLLPHDCTSRGRFRRRQSFGGEQDALLERCCAIASEMGGKRDVGRSSEGKL